MRIYKENTFEEAIAQLKKYTGDTASVSAVKDILNEIGDKVLISYFIRDTGNLMTNYCNYFKGIDKIPTKYWTAIFKYYEEVVSSNPFKRTKAYILGLKINDVDNEVNDDNGEAHIFRNSYIRLFSLETHIDCVYRSLINHMKRNLGIFEIGNKLN